ncbi:uncharacterized protein LOC125229668 [Leguminivora glycinivorella]|uniref:uncharacterized protein LOC125229668 n=1 Tax=Leguminivora glycinivorella TaxID=1035111 RepID=UPI00200F4633|nr:uncharacterized protein LOC125229668 [Leguminivora glycinivorella]
MDIPSVPLEGATVKFRRAQASRLRHQHKLLLHTYKCQREEARAKGESYRCRVMGCQKMRGLVDHMVSCPADKKCSWPSGCTSLRKLMRHYSKCTREYCPACTQKTEWQMTVTEEERSEIVDLLVNMVPTTNSFFTMWFMKSRSNFPTESYLKVTERFAYITAKSRDEYFRTLAVYKWNIEMEIMEIEKEVQELAKRRDEVNSEPEEPDDIEPV